MPFKLVADMTPDELLAHREYMRVAKARWRQNKRNEGKCIVCGGKCPKGLVSCRKCNRQARDRGRNNGYTMGPSKKMQRKGLKLFEEKHYKIRSIAIKLKIDEEFVTKWLLANGFKIGKDSRIAQ